MTGRFSVSSNNDFGGILVPPRGWKDVSAGPIEFGPTAEIGRSSIDWSE